MIVKILLTLDIGEGIRHECNNSNNLIRKRVKELFLDAPWTFTGDDVRIDVMIPGSKHRRKEIERQTQHTIPFGKMRKVRKNNRSRGRRVHRPGKQK